MKDRRTFLAALGVAGASLALRPRNAAAQAAPPTESSPTPAAAQSPSAPRSPKAQRPLPASKRPKKKQPSAAALAVAMTFRRFDAELTDAQIGTIASGIDDGLGAGKTLDPKRKPLHNGDEPVTIFTVPA